MTNKMEKEAQTKLWALAALQFVFFLVILLLWSDRKVSDVLTSYNVLPAYALIQVYLHWGLARRFNTKFVKGKKQ